ncbi:hypothetical protein [Methanothermobacter sp. KEPCO-1]|uniref:hypothetical protein n=1 Tax=Methanothermobacter sp. KEPCO-1 TaxID=2603820 RepID=UPI0016503680|nr:hypothetical protein [Methanothermobacter sp. KEPCO-1]
MGDVKFSLTDTGLPQLESVYNVLSYVEDPGKSPLFKGWDPEGLLVTPEWWTLLLFPLRVTAVSII